MKANRVNLTKIWPDRGCGNLKICENQRKSTNFGLYDDASQNAKYRSDTNAHNFCSTHDRKFSEGSFESYYNVLSYFIQNIFKIHNGGRQNP